MACSLFSALGLFGRLFFFQAEDGIRDWSVTGVQTCALPIPTGAAAEGVSGAMGFAAGHTLGGCTSGDRESGVEGKSGYRGGGGGSGAREVILERQGSGLMMVVRRDRNASATRHRVEDSRVYR